MAYIQCGSDTIPGLLFADDTALLAHDEDSLRKSLNCLVEWCEEWGVGINVSKCGILHTRKKGVERTEMSYSINGEELLLVSNYKYLGCTVHEHLDLDDMVEDKDVNGKKGLGGWFQWCNVKMGEVEIGTFMRLMSSLVESTMMYGVEIWGCNRNMETLQQVQLKAARLFFWRGHPPPKRVPAVGAGRPTSGLAGQAQMCYILVQGPHLPNVGQEVTEEGGNRVSTTWQGLVGEEDGQVLPGFRLGECGATADPESVRDRTKRDAGECSMEKSKGEVERETGEETEVVNYADHHHGMRGGVVMCWDKDEEREENDA